MVSVSESKHSAVCERHPQPAPESRDEVHVVSSFVGNGIGKIENAGLAGNEGPDPLPLAKFKAKPEGVRSKSAGGQGSVPSGSFQKEGIRRCGSRNV